MVSTMMDLMQTHLVSIIKKGQDDGTFQDLISSATISTIILGSMRMTVLKWKLSGHKSDLIKDGNTVLKGLLKMIEK
jgi:hypothetical protein